MRTSVGWQYICRTPFAWHSLGFNKYRSGFLKTRTRISFKQGELKPKTFKTISDFIPLSSWFQPKLFNTLFCLKNRFPRKGEKTTFTCHRPNPKSYSELLPWVCIVLQKKKKKNYWITELSHKIYAPLTTKFNSILTAVLDHTVIILFVLSDLWMAPNPYNAEP